MTTPLRWLLDYEPLPDDVIAFDDGGEARVYFYVVPELDPDSEVCELEIVNAEGEAESFYGMIDADL